MNRRRFVATGSIILGACILAGVFAYGFRHKEQMLERKRQQEEAYKSAEEQNQGEELDGEYNYTLTNVLFIGVDTDEEFTEHKAGWSGQADCLILMSMDKDTKQTRLLEISRDSMTDVDIYDQDGKRIGSQRQQISTQYAYGDGKKRSCQLTTQTVSSLLYEIPIHSYVAMNIDGIARVTELMGGVTVTVPEDYTHIDSTFEKGATLTLQGEKAERYVRYRDTKVTGSNSERMERQNQFLRALATQLQGRSAGWYQKLWVDAEEYIVTDLKVDEIDRLSKFQMAEDIWQVPGDVQAGEEHDEFIVDSAKLKEIILKLFYKSEN